MFADHPRTLLGIPEDQVVECVDIPLFGGPLDGRDIDVEEDDRGFGSPTAATFSTMTSPAEPAMTHWSARLFAEHLSRAGMPVSFAEVARSGGRGTLQPHRVE